MSYRVLLVEDSKQICEGIVDFFNNKAGDEFEFTVFNSGAEAVSYEGEFDIALLDIMLPGASGFDVCKKIRTRSDKPIIFLTALGSEDSVLKGYDLGADDYITKPFSLAQLFAKVQALLKRVASGEKERKVLTTDGIELDPVSLRVFALGNEVELTSKEFFLLKALLENKGMVLTRDQLLTRVWGFDFDGNDRVVDTTIKRLRKSLGDAGDQIKTSIGRGYKIL